MGTLYLIDAHNVTIANSEINDTIPLEAGNSQLINGSFVVRVPFSTSIDGTPTDLTDLFTKKFAGLLAYYPGFTYIDYEDGLDATGWSVANSVGITLGARGTTSLNVNGVLQSNSVSLSESPTDVVVLWEVFDLTPADPKDGVLTRSYKEASSADLTGEVTFDNGTSWNTVTDGVMFAVPLARQGTNFKIRLTNDSADRKWIGGWAILSARSYPLPPEPLS